MPGTLSPPRDSVGTANHDNRPDDYAFDYRRLLALATVTARSGIGEVLSQGKGMTTQDQLKLMLDIDNLQSRRLLPVLVKALQADPAQARFASILAAWDGREDAAQPAPLIYHRLYEQLAYETYVDDMGDKLARTYLGQWYMWQERFDELLRTPDSPWFDDARTPNKETLPDLVRRAAATVRAELEAKHGADPAAWRWGDAHRIHFFGALRRNGAGRDLLGFAEKPMNGSGETLMRALTPYLGDGQVQFFASMRLVADMGDDETGRGCRRRGRPPSPPEPEGPATGLDGRQAADVVVRAEAGGGARQTSAGAGAEIGERVGASAGRSNLRAPCVSNQCTRQPWTPRH